MNNQEIINFYEQGNSMAACARKFSTYPEKIKKILLKNNIHVRNRSEQLVIENQRRGYKINHNYFDELDNTKVYWLGFLAADGTVRKNTNEIKIGLQKNDEQLLKDFKQCLQSEAPLHYYLANNKYEVVEFRFSSSNIKTKLAQYSIVPNKTYIGITMKNIPDKYKLSFIKGFFDGDGSYSCGKVKFTSHTKEILEEIQQVISQKTYLYYSEKRNVYSLEMSTIPSIDFLKTIYSIETPCLKRKYNKYLEAIN